MSVLRAIEPGDLPTLQRIRAAAFAPVFQSFRDLVGPEIAAFALASADSDQAKLLNDICAAESGHQVLVAVLHERAVGFVAFTVKGDMGEIVLNAVDPQFAGQGIGAHMFEDALARMKAQGAKVATVGVGGDASHAPARRAYEKAGFGPGIPSHWLYKLL